MGIIVVDLLSTLDGVYQAPGGPDEDRGGGFEFGGWQAPYFDKESGEAIGAGIERIDALLLGRKTYDIFAGFWPTAPADDPIAARFNTVPKYVASHTLTGTGKRIFQEGTIPSAFAVAQPPRAFPKGAVWLVYERAGDPATGVDIEAERAQT